MVPDVATAKATAFMSSLSALKRDLCILVLEPTSAGNAEKLSHSAVKLGSGVTGACIRRYATDSF